MKIIKYSIYTGLSLILLLTIACNKQLNQTPPSQIETSVFYSNTQDFTQDVTGAYNHLRAYPVRVLWLGAMRSDNINSTSNAKRDWQNIKDMLPNFTSMAF